MISFEVREYLHNDICLMSESLKISVEQYILTLIAMKVREQVKYEQKYKLEE